MYYRPRYNKQQRKNKQLLSCKVFKAVLLVVIMCDKEEEQLADKQRKQQGRQGTSQSRSESQADKSEKQESVNETGSQPYS